MQSLRPASSPRSVKNLDEGAACGTRQGFFKNLNPIFITRQGSRDKKKTRGSRGPGQTASPDRRTPSVAMFDRLKPLGNCKDREE